MPIGFDPDETCTVHLDCVDEGKADEQRARFKVRLLTSGEVKRVERMREAALRAATLTETDRLLNEAIRFGIVGWEGLAVSYKPAPALVAEGSEPEADVLDEFEQRLKFAIVAEYPTALLLTAHEKKA